ncbi:MAG: hypothetical protein ACE5KT_02090 [Methanosarcinales archaeon]
MKKYPKIEKPIFSQEFVEKLKKEGVYHVSGTCLECGGKVEVKNDLVLVNKKIIVRGLSGEKCVDCGAVTYTLDSYSKIKKAIDEFGYSGTLSIKDGYPILYFKEDFAKRINLKGEEMVSIYPLSENEFIVRRKVKANKETV